MPERVGHLYACQGLSTYRIADLAGISRQRVTRMLHRAGVAVKPQGAGRRRASGGGQYPAEFLAILYQRLRLNCAEISAVTGIPSRTIRDRLVASGVRMRTRGGSNREDRTALDPVRLAALYVQAGLPADETGKLLGVSRHLVLRTAHDEGFPVRVGGPPPGRGPAEIKLLNALYADAQVRQVLHRHALPQVPAGGPIWQRFPVPLPLTGEVARELYVSCGLSTRHIELLTGQPSDSVRRLLVNGGILVRGAGGRSPFMRRWRAG
jgi:transposase-like protein